MSARFGFARTLFVFDNQGLGFKPSSLGLPASIDANVDREMFPRFGVGGMMTLGGNDHRYNAFMSYTTAAPDEGAGGAHAERRFEADAGVNVWDASAGRSTSRQRDAGPQPEHGGSTAGYGFASLLLGSGSRTLLIQNWKNVRRTAYTGRLRQDDARQLALTLTPVPIRHRRAADERFNRMKHFVQSRVRRCRAGAGVPVSKAAWSSSGGDGTFTSTTLTRNNIARGWAGR